MKANLSYGLTTVNIDTANDIYEITHSGSMGNTFRDEMKTYKIEAGAIVDKWKADSEEQALNLFAQDAGYKDYESLVSEHGEVDTIEEYREESDVIEEGSPDYQYKMTIKMPQWEN